LNKQSSNQKKAAVTGGFFYWMERQSKLIKYLTNIRQIDLEVMKCTNVCCADKILSGD
jgi:hypothetical protein